MKSLSKFFIVFALMTILGVITWFYCLDSKSPIENNQVNSSDTSQSSSSQRNTKTVAAKPKNNSSLATANANSESEKSWPEKSAWNLNTTIQPAMPLPPSISIYAPVELPEQDFYPQTGEQLSLPLPQADAVTVTIESSESHANGDYTWRGHLQGYGNDYPVVTTYGKHSTFSTITTPQGSYTLEVINNQGWIYKNPSVHELSAPGHEDGLEIP
jgi:hypothetical protein